MVGEFFFDCLMSSNVVGESGKVQIFLRSRDLNYGIFFAAFYMYFCRIEKSKTVV